MDKNKKKTLATFSLASFLNDMGSDMIMPIWPVFVTEVLKVNMSVLGIIDGLGDAIVSISQALAGYFSDRLKKRKFFIWLGYFCAGIARFGYAISSIWWQVIPFKILDRSGKMREAPRDAIVAELSKDGNRGRNFGFLNAFDSLGAVFGIAINLLLFSVLGYQKLFMLAAIPSFLAVVLVFFVIKEKKAEEVILYKGITFRNFSGNFKLFLILSAIFQLGLFSWSFLLIFAKKAGFGTAFLPILYLIFTASTSLADFIFGKLSDKLGRKFVLNLAFLFWALTCVSFALTNNYWIILLTFVLYGFHKGAKETVQKAYVSELAHEQFKASSLGAYQMVLGLMALPASVIAGLLWDKFGQQAPFYFSMGLTVAAGFLLMFVKKNKRTCDKRTRG